MAATPMHKRSLPGAPATTKDNIKVFVRTRPLLDKEIQQDYYSVLNVYKERHQVITEDGKVYQFDGVFEERSTQEEVYKKTLSPLISQVLAGQNVTVLAYGQTGSGKTFTMGTDPSLSKDKEGLIQRALENLLQQTSSPLKDLEDTWNDKRRSSGRALKKTQNTTVKLSFLEIYNESVFDLLSSDRRVLKTKPDRLGGVSPIDVQEKSISDVLEGITLLQRGNKLRSVSSTIMNNHSSRSHALITFKLFKYGKETSCLRLVDLAGAEGVGKAQMAGQQFNEGVSINTGLLTLGKVLTALSSGSTHIPYRESIVTRLLRDSLGGSSKTVMIACVSPANASLTETLNILRYAEQARNVRSKPVMAPPSTLKKGIKRRLGDVSATPSSFKKRFHSKAQRPTHNTTVSTPGNRPFISTVPEIALSTTFTSAGDVLNSTTLTSMDEDLSVERSEEMPIVKSLFTQPSFMNSHSNNKIKDNRNSEYIDKINSLENKIDKMLDLFSKPSKKKQKKTKHPTHENLVNLSSDNSMDLTNESIDTSSSTPDLHKTLETVLLKNIDMKRVMEEYAEKTVRKMLLQPRRSARLSSSTMKLEYTNTTFRSPFTNITNIQETSITDNKNDKTFMEKFLESKSDSPSFLPRASTVRLDSRAVRKSTRLMMKNSFPEDIVQDMKFDVTLTEESCLRDVDDTINNTFNDTIIPNYSNKKNLANNTTILTSSQNSPHLSKNITNLILPTNSSSPNTDNCEKINTTMYDGDVSLLPIDKYMRQRQEDNTTRRRSTRRSAAIATQRNYDLFHKPSPALDKTTTESRLNTTTRRSRRSTAANKTTKLNSTLNTSKSKLNVTVSADMKDQWSLVVSPTIMKKHNKKILDILNDGSLKQLQTLPTVGPKTAMVIYNFRTMYGKLKNIEDLKNVPGLAKNYYTRFMKANLMERLDF